MIDSETIKQAVYDLCVQANTNLPEAVLKKLFNAYEKETLPDAKSALGLILENAQIASEKKMPLCQDTGQVLVFLKSNFFPPDIKKTVTNAVEEAYEKNFFRKSVVKNAFFDRTNTKTNTPCIIYTELSDETENFEIEVLIKGAGTENVGEITMLSPTADETEIINLVVNTVKKAGSKACPPYFIGVGAGGTMEYAALLSKKALFLDENLDENHKNLAEKIQNAINELEIGAAGLGGAHTALDVKILTDFTHIACMPVAVTINCHSLRHAKCIINNQNVIKNNFSPLAINIPQVQQPDFIHVKTTDICKLKSLKRGDNVLLSGEIFTARDAAHQRLIKMIKNGEKLPLELKDKIIFYAGPCPCCEGCVVGSIGPTTSARMDKYAAELYEKGLLGTIGKGERSEEIKKIIKKTGGIYFTIIGGIASYLSQKFIKKELIAFEDLGAEAIYRFEVKDLPLRVEF